ncbi:MAG: winged helix-turn-helix domain-containing protein [Candidatus Nitrosocaldus sp.]
MHYKREGLDIVMMLLSSLKEMRTITQIMHAARLDTRTSSKYVQMLLKKGLIERVDNGGNVCYTITEKGSRLLLLCEELKSMLKDNIGEEKEISLIYL